MWNAADGEAVRRGWAAAWVDETVRRLGILDWGRVREVLGSVMWIGFVYDSEGRVFFDGAFARIGRGWGDTGSGACLIGSGS